MTYAAHVARQAALEGKQCISCESADRATVLGDTRASVDPTRADGATPAVRAEGFVTLHPVSLLDSPPQNPSKSHTSDT